MENFSSECPVDDADCHYVPFTPAAKMGIGMGVGFAVFSLIFLTVGFWEQYLKDKAEEEYQQMVAEQKLREKLLKTARHVDQITAMVTNTGLNIVDVTQLQFPYAAAAGMGFKDNQDAASQFAASYETRVRERLSASMMAADESGFLLPDLAATEGDNYKKLKGEGESSTDMMAKLKKSASPKLQSPPADLLTLSDDFMQWESLFKMGCKARVKDKNSDGENDAKGVKSEARARKSKKRSKEKGLWQRSTKANNSHIEADDGEGRRKKAERHVQLDFNNFDEPFDQKTSHENLIPTDVKITNSERDASLSPDKIFSNEFAVLAEVENSLGDLTASDIYFEHADADDPEPEELEEHEEMSMQLESQSASDENLEKGEAHLWFSGNSSGRRIRRKDICHPRNDTPEGELIDIEDCVQGYVCHDSECDDGIPHETQEGNHDVSQADMDGAICNEGEPTEDNRAVSDGHGVENYSDVAQENASGDTIDQIPLVRTSKLDFPSIVGKSEDELQLGLSNAISYVKRVKEKISQFEFPYAAGSLDHEGEKSNPGLFNTPSYEHVKEKISQIGFSFMAGKAPQPETLKLATDTIGPETAAIGHKTLVDHPDVERNHKVEAPHDKNDSKAIRHKDGGLHKHMPFECTKIPQSKPFAKENNIEGRTKLEYDDTSKLSPKAKSPSNPVSPFKTASMPTSPRRDNGNGSPNRNHAGLSHQKDMASSKSPKLNPKASETIQTKSDASPRFRRVPRNKMASKKSACGSYVT